MRAEPPAPGVRPVLILAGTAGARDVLAATTDRHVVASLAGRTAAPQLPVPVRIGGFGGEDGLRAALRGYAAVLDATHPYAATMSARAARLCARAGIPHLRLSRPGWPPEAHWHRHACVEDAATTLPAGAHVFLTTGPGAVAAFVGRGLTLFCRRVDPARPLSGMAWIVGRPGDAAAEADLMRAHGITHLVTKDSGGPLRGKLDAALALGVAIHVVDRPPPPPGEETHDIDAAIAFVQTHAPHRDR